MEETQTGFAVKEWVLSLYFIGRRYPLETLNNIGAILRLRPPQKKIKNSML